MPATGAGAEGGGPPAGPGADGGGDVDEPGGGKAVPNRTVSDVSRLPFSKGTRVVPLRPLPTLLSPTLRLPHRLLPLLSVPEREVSWSG